jgi:hypothetical protein
LPLAVTVPETVVALAEGALTASALPITAVAVSDGRVRPSGCSRMDYRVTPELFDANYVARRGLRNQGCKLPPAGRHSLLS